MARKGDGSGFWASPKLMAEEGTQQAFDGSLASPVALRASPAMAMAASATGARGTVVQILVPGRQRVGLSKRGRRSVASVHTQRVAAVLVSVCARGRWQEKCSGAKLCSCRVFVARPGSPCLYSGVPRSSVVWEQQIISLAGRLARRCGDHEQHSHAPAMASWTEIEGGEVRSDANRAKRRRLELVRGQGKVAVMAAFARRRPRVCCVHDGRVRVWWRSAQVRVRCWGERVQLRPSASA